MKTVKERDNLDLLELVVELHHRAISFPSEEMHNAYIEARKELEGKLSQFHPSPEIPEISDEEIEKAFPVDRVAIDALFSDDMKGEERREAISWTQQKNLFKRTGIIWYRTKLREGGKKDE